MIAPLTVALLAIAVAATALEGEGVAVACISGAVCVIKFWS